jgi:hypothetical protein
MCERTRRKRDAALQRRQQFLVVGPHPAFTSIAGRRPCRRACSARTTRP